MISEIWYNYVSTKHKYLSKIIINQINDRWQHNNNYNNKIIDLNIEKQEIISNICHEIIRMDWSSSNLYFYRYTRENVRIRVNDALWEENVSTSKRESLKGILWIVILWNPWRFVHRPRRGYLVRDIIFVKVIGCENWDRMVCPMFWCFHPFDLIAALL